MSEINRTKLPGFPMGVISNLNNQAEFPEQALANGENVKLTNGVSTRGGTSITSSGSLPAGEVVFSKQVRFPTNESSYMLVQVKTTSGPEWVESDDWPARNRHVCVYDSTRDRFIVWGGITMFGTCSECPKLYFYNYVTNEWSVTDEDVGWPDTLHGAGAVYDPIDDRMIVVCGLTEGDQDPSDKIWALDCDTLTWSELTTTGTKPQTTETSCEVYGCSYIATSHKIILHVGYGTSDKIYILDLATLAWTNYDGFGQAESDFGIISTYVPEQGALYALGGSNWISGEPTDAIRKYDVSGNSWSTMLYSLHDPMWWTSAASRDGNIYIYAGNIGGFEDGDTLYNVQRIDPTTGDWTGWELHDMLVECATIAFGAADNMLLVGGQSEMGGSASYYTDNITAASGNKLYASPDQLPTETAEFTRIYDLGEGAGTVSAAVLNDRCVITEGINNPPLVWGGAMAADASDWMYPKQVLVSQDGSNFYDISSQVLDKDVDNAAGIGGILSSGYIAVCCDVPKVEGFYVEVETPNTSVGGVINTVELTQTYSSNTKVDRENYSTSGDTWTRTSDKTGTLTCSDAATRALIKPGMMLVTSSGTSAIETIDYPNVTLFTDVANGTVSDIYGLDVANDLVEVTNYSDEPETVFDAATLNAGDDRWTLWPYNGCSIRQIISGSALSNGGTQIRVTLRASDITQSGSGIAITNNGIVFSHVSIVEQSTGTDGTTTPTEITFNGQSGCTIAQGATATSDFIPFEVDVAKTYILIMDIPKTTAKQYP